MTTRRNRGTAVQEAVGARVRIARRLANYTQQEIAVKMGLSRAGYAHIEDGTRTMTLDDLFNLARLVFRSPTFLLGEPTELTSDEDQLLAAFRQIDSDRQRRLIVDLTILAAKSEEAGAEAEAS